MKVIITGGAGFLGQKLARALLEETSPLSVKELILVDVCSVTSPVKDQRVQCITADLGNPEVANQLLDSNCGVIFHLAAIVSGHAESDFDLGMKINFDATRHLLETARQKVPTVKFIFTSTCAVYGGVLPIPITDHTAVTPENSYGMEKALCELLINDYSRKGFIDGIVVRLPTVTVRPGKANKAVTSFVSGIVREPLNGQLCTVPISDDLPIWVCSPHTVIKNIIHASLITTNSLQSWRVVNLPGITVTVKEIISALKTVAGNEAVSCIKFEENETIKKIMLSFPRYYDIRRALDLGFSVDHSFADIIRAYIKDDLMIQ